MRGKWGWTEGKMIPGRGKTICNGQGETWPVGGVITANLEHRLQGLRVEWCRVRLERPAGLLCPCRGVPPTGHAEGPSLTISPFSPLGPGAPAGPAAPMSP